MLQELFNRILLNMLRTGINVFSIAVASLGILWYFRYATFFGQGQIKVMGRIDLILDDQSREWRRCKIDDLGF